jgi:glycosyltransferase involved in cell wall biosynthesis
MNNPKISVIMPNYNAGLFIAEAIEGVLNQTFKEFEFIIIDDGSTDDSWSIIQKYAQKDPRIIALKNEKNVKICKTLNRGLEIARGDYIARMDSDDVATPTWLSTILLFMEKTGNRQVGVCGSNFFMIDANGKDIGKKTFPETDEACKQAFWFRNPMGHNTVLIRKKCFAELGVYDDNFLPAEDLELWMRFGQKYKLHNIQKFLVKYRVSGNNSTIKNQKIMIKAALKCRATARDKCGYKMTFKGYVSFVITWFAQFFPPKLVFWAFNLFKK